MYPSKLSYQTAVMNQMFPASENGGYTFQPVLVNEDPVLSSGGNAIVFKVVDGAGDFYAIKLFTEEKSGRQQRLRKISNHLDEIKSKYFTHFTYVDKLIYVDMPGLKDEECYFPGIVMKWLNGKTLDEKIRSLVESKEQIKILTIAERFKVMCQQLLKLGIAHGDLKLSNIMIDDQLNLYLIDYDGMYVPELEGEYALENGTPSYQHPLRSPHHFKSEIDHFSILNIYYSLLAIATRSQLYTEYNDGDNIIFSKSDLENPTTSKLFRLLESEKIYLNVLYFLKNSLLSNSIEISFLNEVLQGKFPNPKIDISHEPVQLVEGQTYVLKWSSSMADFLFINGEEHPLNGEKIFTAGIFSNHEFEFGYADIKHRVTYQINAKRPPVIQYFEPQHYFLKEDEPLILKWKIKNAETIHLLVNDENIDVTGKNNIELPSPKQDISITIKAKAKSIDFYEEKSIIVAVCHPVSLVVEQDKKITIPNQQINLSLRVQNADSLILKPGNIDLTGKTTYAITSYENMTFQIVASNKRYSESYSGKIDVLKYPSYRESVIQIPELHIKIPELSLKIPSFDLRKQQRPNAISILESVRLAFRNLSWKKIHIKRKLS